MLAVYGKETNEIGVQSLTTPGSSRAQSTLFSHVHPSQVSKLLHKILDLGTPGNKFIAWAKSTQRGHENINHTEGIAHTTASTDPPRLHLAQLPPPPAPRVLPPSSKFLFFSFLEKIFQYEKYRE